MQESISQRDFYGDAGMHYMASQAVYDYTQSHDDHLSLQERMRHPVAFHAEMMGDIMHLHQALQQPDAPQFVQAVVREINGHIKNDHWRLIRRDEVPKGHKVTPSVWAMRRKRNLITNEIKSHKARLNLHGGKQVYGVNYFETYAPVVTWFAIRLMIIVAIMSRRSLRQIDFVMAYTQAPIETDLYMEIPQGIETTEGNTKDYVLQLLANLYGQKQAGRVWNQYLVNKLESIGFTQSRIDECVFYRDDIIFIVYVDDGIFLGTSDDQLSHVIKELTDIGLQVEDQGHPADYVGVNINRLPDGSYKFSQRTLIDSIIADVGLTSHDFKHWNYRSAVGKLNYLSQTSRPDIQYATHMVAKYSSNPKQEHGQAIIYIARYLIKTRDLGLHFKPDSSKGFYCYADADFSGEWNKEFAELDPSTAKSRSGWFILYANCPVIWCSKLQSQVALSTTEAEYIALSQALRDVIPIMALLHEMRERQFHVICEAPRIYCKAFEDNSGALELARLPKLRPRTKHINVCYHHFREHVRKGLIKIYPIETENQVADVLTKPLPQNSFCHHRAIMCGC
ncbi:hypothetical protein ACHAW6_008691 [Cyclotella cf. meneghiniana]